MLRTCLVRFAAGEGTLHHHCDPDLGRPCLFLAFPLCLANAWEKGARGRFLWATSVPGFGTGRASERCWLLSGNVGHRALSAAAAQVTIAFESNRARCAAEGILYRELATKTVPVEPWRGLAKPAAPGAPPIRRTSPKAPWQDPGHTLATEGRAMWTSDGQGEEPRALRRARRGHAKAKQVRDRSLRTTKRRFDHAPRPGAWQASAHNHTMHQSLGLVQHDRASGLNCQPYSSSLQPAASCAVSAACCAHGRVSVSARGSLGQSMHGDTPSSPSLQSSHAFRSGGAKTLANLNVLQSCPGKKRTAPPN